MSDTKEYVVMEKSDIAAIGDAIREKEESTELIPTKEMPARIRAIETGATPTGVITITENGTHDVARYGTAIVDIQQTQAEASDLDKLIDGTIVSFALPEGITKVADYKFYNHTALAEAVLTGLVTLGQYAFRGCTALKQIVIPSTVTSVGQYAFDGCSKVESIVVNNKTLANYQFQNNYIVSSLSLNPEINSIPSCCFQYCGRDGTGFELYFGVRTTLASSAFRYSGVVKVEGIIRTNDSYAFADCKKLEIVNINPDNYRLQSHTFAGCTNLKEIKIKSSYASFYFNTNCFQNCTAVEMFDITELEYITQMGNYVFQNFGNARSNVDTERLILDFSKYKFTSVGQYTFAGLKNTNVILPSTVTTINANAFNGCEKLDLFLNSSPTLSNVSAFASNKNLNLFIDYNNIDALISKTNWTAYQENIKGVLTGVTELPSTTTAGQDVLWYYDSNFTQLVGSDVIDAATTYYCKIGPVYLTKMTGLNCSIIVSDANDNVYAEGDPIVLGTVLDFAFQPVEGQGIPYQVKVNNVAVDLADFSNYMSGHIMEDDLSIVAIYWDGITMPYNPTFADNDWGLIALGIKTRVGFDIGWKIGDTKTVETSDGRIYTLRIADATPDRYAYADGSGNSQAVIEFVEGLPTTMALNDTTKENGYWAGGGWAMTDMNNTKLPNFLATLPSELQEAISEVSLTGYSVTSPSPRIATSKLFLPNEYEIWGRAYYSNTVEATTQFQLYAEKGAAAMKKYRLGSTSNEWFWTRSPYSGSSHYFTVWQGASYSYYNTYSDFGVAPVFAI